MNILNQARKAALKTILQVEQGQHLQEALNQVLSAQNIGGNVAGQVSDLVYGYFRTCIRLEKTLQTVLPALHKIPKNLRILLALAVYSLLFQDRKAIYAVFDQTVEYAKKKYGKGLAGVVNASLRSLQRRGEELQDISLFIGGKKQIWRGFADFYAMPQAVAKLWLDAYGEEQLKLLLQRSFQRPRTGIRLAPGHASFAELKKFFLKLGSEIAFPVGETGFALMPGAVSEIAGFDLQHWQKEGAIRLQAAGSQVIMEKLGLWQWREPVWDCCAGAGGKTLALLDNGISVTLATDLSAKRLATLQKLANINIARANAACPPLAVWDGNILLDAPCSGLGVLARRPDIKNKFNKEEIKKLNTAQMAILQGAGALLKPGKKLAYITCALNPDENELLINGFLQAHPEFRLEQQWQTPHEHPWLEGMYGAVLLRA